MERYQDKDSQDQNSENVSKYYINYCSNLSLICRLKLLHYSK